MVLNFIKKIRNWIKNNLFLIFSFSILIITFVLITLLSYFLKNIFWNFVKNWQSIFLPFLSFLIYIWFYFWLILLQKLVIKRRWQKENINKINQLINNNQIDNFINYKNKINEIIKEIKILFDYSNESKENKSYSTNILFFYGDYGTGKTFIISNVLNKIKENKIYNDNIENYYIDISTIENESKTDFSKYLFNEIMKCIYYEYFLKNFQYLKFFNIFNKKPLFNFIKNNITIKNEKNRKKIIILDELDRCNPDNIINTFSILKNYFSNVNNVIIVIIASENIIKPIILDHLKLKDVNKNSQVCYEDYFRKIINKFISINDINYFNYSKVIINNDIIKNTELEFNDFMNSYMSNKNKKNTRYILKKIIDKKNIASDSIILNFLNNKKNKNEKFIEEFYQFIYIFYMIKIICNIIPNNINNNLINSVIEKDNTFEFSFIEYWKFLKIINLYQNQNLVKISYKNELTLINLNNKTLFTCLTCDNQGNLYGCTINNEIFSINKKTGAFYNKISNSSENKKYLIIIYNELFYWNKITENIFINNSAPYNICEIINRFHNNKKCFLLSILLCITKTNNTWIRGNLKSEIDNLDYLLKNYIFSFSVITIIDKLKYDYKNHYDKFDDYYLCNLYLYCLSFKNDEIYNINSINNNYLFSLSKQFLNNYINQEYNNCFVFYNKGLRKMNFFDYYYIVQKDIKFKIINIGYNKNFYNKKNFLNLINTIFFDLNKIIHRNEKIYLAIILEFKPNKSKIIFDLSKIIDEIILENTFESIFWKIGNKTKKDNNIIKKYDNFIHKKIINLLNLENNDEIEKIISKLKKHIKDNKKNK